MTERKMIEGMPETIRLHLWPVELTLSHQDEDGGVWWRGHLPNGAVAVVAAHPGRHWFQIYADVCGARAALGAHAPTLIEAERAVANSRDAMEAAARVTDALRIAPEMPNAAE